MAMNMNVNTSDPVKEFEIPDELAQELSDLLVKQTVRETLLTTIMMNGNEKAYDAAEQNLMEVVGRIETIKKIITRDYVPIGYRSADFMWNYDGYELDGNKIRIYNA